MGVYSVDKLMSEARRLAAEYRRTTGKPLAGVSGEISRYDAGRLLDLEICNPPIGGYDAIGRGKREGKRIQIKGRAIFKEGKTGQRIGQLRLDQEWDCVMLVLMDENLEPFEIHEAERDAIIEAVGERQSGNRSKRGALSVAKFKHIGHLAWTRENGVEEDEIWDNQVNL